MGQARNKISRGTGPADGSSVPKCNLGTRRQPVAALVRAWRTDHRLTAAATRLMARVGDAPHGAVAVLGHEQRAVVGNGHAHRPAPDAAIVHDKTGEKVVVLAGGN